MLQMTVETRAQITNVSRRCHANQAKSSFLHASVPRGIMVILFYILMTDE